MIQNSHKMKSKEGPKSKIKQVEIPSQKTYKIFLTGFNPNPYTKEDLGRLLKYKIPGYQGVILPKSIYKGFAFIDVRSKEEAQQALAMRFVEIGGYKMHLKEFKQGKKLEKERLLMNEKKVFISLIPDSWKVKDLEEIFCQFGALEEIYITSKKHQEASSEAALGSKIGFAIYKDKETARRVYMRKVVVHRGVTLEVKQVEDRTGLTRKMMNMSGSERQSEGSKRENDSSVATAKLLSQKTARPVLSGFSGTVRGGDNPQGTIRGNLTEGGPSNNNNNPQFQFPKVTGDMSCEILEEGFEAIFAKFGIRDFKFEEFMKYTAFQYLNYKRMMGDLQQKQLLMPNSTPNLTSPLPDSSQFEKFFTQGVQPNNNNNPQKKERVDKSAGIKNFFDEFRRVMNYHNLRPTDTAHHSAKLRLGYKLDHKMRNLRVNGREKEGKKLWSDTVQEEFEAGEGCQ